MNNKKESTPVREMRRRYEEEHKEERKEKNAQFSTFIPRKDFEEINEFLKHNRFTKVELIYAGYDALKMKLSKNIK